MQVKEAGGKNDDVNLSRGCYSLLIFGCNRHPTHSNLNLYTSLFTFTLNKQSFPITLQDTETWHVYFLKHLLPFNVYGNNTYNERLDLQL